MSLADSIPIINKRVLLTPRLLDVHEDSLPAEELPTDFVGMGDIMGRKL